jgi:hypothetical protein
VQVGLAGPLHVAEGGMNYLLTMTDRTSRWVEAAPLREMSASTCAESFVSTWVLHVTESLAR